MVGVLLALTSQANNSAIMEALGPMHVIETDNRTELLEQVAQLRPDVLLLDAYHAQNQELLATYRGVAPWGYIVLIYQQLADLQLTNHVDEVWPVSNLAARPIKLLLRLAKLNRYNNQDNKNCALANSDELCNESCFKRLEPFFVTNGRFVSPGVWGRKFLEEWNFLLPHVLRVFGISAITTWPCSLSANLGSANKVGDDNRCPALTSTGVRLDRLLDTGASLLSVSFEGAYFPVAVVGHEEKVSDYAQQVAEAASNMQVDYYGATSESPVPQLLNDVIQKIVSTLNRQYSVALYSFGQCVFCQDTITDQAYYNAISLALELGVVLLDANHSVVYASELAVRLLTSSPVVNDALNSKLPLLDKILDQLVHTRQSVRSKFTLTVSSHKRLAISVAQATTPEGVKLGYVVTVQDEAKAKELQIETRLRERLASVGELAAGMAHEIRNPLTSIRGFMQLLKQRLVVGQMEAETRYADYVLEEIDRANHVVTNFLTLAKPKDEVWLPVDVNELLAKMLQLVENQAMLKGVYLTWQFAPGLPSICGKPEALVQVFLNIMTNALQATPKGGSIHILTRQQGDNVLVSVQDTGVGMNPDVQTRIFNPFYSTKEGGTGLGLALCRQIVGEHHGEIQVTSTIGVGSCFTICLPVTNGCIGSGDFMGDH